MSVGSTFPRGAICTWLGDSLTDANGGIGGAVCWYGPLPAQMVAAFMSGVGVVDGAPIHIVKGVAGNTIAQVTARVTTDVPVYATAVIVCIGDNDGTSGRTQPQANTDTLALIDAIVARCPNLSCLIIQGPFIAGDKWPTGANTYDVGLDAVNAGMLQACTTRGVKFVNLRAKIMSDLPTLNPGNTLGASGLVIDNASDGSCKHPNGAGQAYISSYFRSQVTFAT